MGNSAAWPPVSEADDQWIRDHFQELIDKYPGKYVGVLDERILLVSEDPVEIDHLAEKVAPDRLPSVILVPFEEDFPCLLQATPHKLSQRGGLPRARPRGRVEG